jgi:phosphate transport system substrate-binding protein
MIARLHDFLRRDGLRSVPSFLYSWIEAGANLKAWLRYGAVFIVMLVCVACGQNIKERARSTSPIAPEGLLIAGSGSNIALTRQLAAEYSRQSGLKIDISGSIGTVGAVKASREGAISLGLASRALTPAELAQGLRQLHYASTGLAIAVHSSVPDTEMDYHALAQIYAGEKTAWTNGAGIVALCMYEHDSTNDLLLKKVPGFSFALQKALARNDWRTLYHEGAMLETLTRTPNAIGFVDAVALAEKQGQVKAIKLNGAEMTPENIRSGRYPLKKELYFIYHVAPSEAAQRFIEFCVSDPGHQIILDNGAVPAPRKE